MARRLARAQSTQKYCLVPFSTEQVQVGGAPSGAEVPQRAQATGWASGPGGAGWGVGWSTCRRYPRGPGAERGAHRGAGPFGPAPRVLRFFGCASRQCMTAMASARLARSDTRSARRCMRRAATRRRA